MSTDAQLATAFGPRPETISLLTVARQEPAPSSSARTAGSLTAMDAVRVIALSQPHTRETQMIASRSLASSVTASTDWSRSTVVLRANVVKLLRETPGAAAT